MSERLPVDMKCVADPWLKGRIYVRVSANENPVSMLRRLGSSVLGAYVHRKIVPITGQDEEVLVEHSQMRREFTERFPAQTWVKIRYGVFAGDVGYVENGSHDSDMLKLLVVPRLSEDGRKHRMSGSRKGRGPQVLFQPDLFSRNSERVLQPGSQPGSWLIDNEEEYLSNGLRALKVTGIHYVKQHRPTAEELQLFTIAGIDTVRETNEAFLRQRDRVKIVKGGFKGCEGVVVSIEGDSVRIRRSMNMGVEEGEEMLVGLREVKRCFNIGSNVVIRLGPGKGRRGMVVDELPREIVMVETDTREEVWFPSVKEKETVTKIL